ncbi:hypothetical protein FB451DRAFT_1168445 [Mycena latifolia]|nr:hypothetical protein FB451DRAFT_1168445 [Mycena latifolia]
MLQSTRGSAGRASEVGGRGRRRACLLCMHGKSGEASAPPATLLDARRESISAGERGRVERPPVRAMVQSRKRSAGKMARTAMIFESVPATLGLLDTAGETRRVARLRDAPERGGRDSGIPRRGTVATSTPCAHGVRAVHDACGAWISCSVAVGRRTSEAPKERGDCSAPDSFKRGDAPPGALIQNGQGIMNNCAAASSEVVKPSGALPHPLVSHSAEREGDPDEAQLSKSRAGRSL